jgi:hypothetical protein
MGRVLSKKALEDTSVILIGQEPNGLLDRNARRICEECVRSGLDTYRVDYPAIEKIPQITNRRHLVVMLFFPHAFWDENCEVPSDNALYGTSWTSFLKFKDFFIEVSERLTQILKDRRVSYLVNPESAFVDRDKVQTVEILKKAGIPTPTTLYTRDLRDIQSSIDRDQGVFIKCRFGAEGKGITYLSKFGWWTNYRIDGDRLANFGVRDRWHFEEITGRRDLLAQLLDQEVIVEKEIVTPEVDPGSKFDLRAYVIHDECPHMFLRVNQREAMITNYSQGARTIHRYEDVLNPTAIRKAKNSAKEAAKALNFPFVGVDLMFDRNGAQSVVETQVFTDFPDQTYFNLSAYLANQIRVRIQ